MKRSLSEGAPENTLIGLEESAARELLKTLPAEEFVALLTQYQQNFIQCGSYEKHGYQTLNGDLRSLFQLFHYHQFKIKNPDPKGRRLSVWLDVEGQQNESSATKRRQYIAENDTEEGAASSIIKYLKTTPSSHHIWHIDCETLEMSEETKIVHQKYLMFIEFCVKCAQIILTHLMTNLQSKEKDCALEDMDNLLSNLPLEDVKRIGSMAQFNALLLIVATAKFRFYFHPLIQLGADPYLIENNLSPLIESIKVPGSRLLDYMCNQFKMDTNKPLNFDRIHAICPDPIGLAIQHGSSADTIQMMLDVGFDANRCVEPNDLIIAFQQRMAI